MAKTIKKLYYSIGEVSKITGLKQYVFRHLPWFDQGLPVLVVGKDGIGKFKTTPLSSSGNNRSIINWNIDLSDDGSATVEGNTQLYGAFASDLRELLLYSSPEGKRNWVDMYLSDRCSCTRLDTFCFEGTYPSSDPLTVKYTFSTEAFSVIEKDQMLIYPSQIIDFDLPDFFRTLKRVQPIQMKHDSQTILNLNIRLPGQYILTNTGLSDSLTSKFGSGMWETVNTDSTIKVLSDYKTKSGSIEPEDYPDFQRFIDDIRKRDLRPLILSKR